MLRSAEDSSSEYHLMHKHLVGPRTVGRLLLHYTELTQSQSIERMYEAGWAAAEAALVADSTLTENSRLEMLEMANDSWQCAQDICHERTLDNSTPCHDRALRIETSRATLPVFSTMVQGTFTTPVRKAYHATLLDIAGRSANLLEHSVENRGSHIGNYKGLCAEQLGILALSREVTGRLVAMPSLARSDSGTHYPRETHDIQVLSHHRGVRRSITPVEIKFSRSPDRYNAPVLNARRHLGVSSALSAVELTRLYEKDFHQPELMTDADHTRLGGIKLAMIGLISDYRRKQMSRTGPTQPSATPPVAAA